MYRVDTANSIQSFKTWIRHFARSVGVRLMLVLLHGYRAADTGAIMRHRPPKFSIQIVLLDIKDGTRDVSQYVNWTEQCCLMRSRCVRSKRF